MWILCTLFNLLFVDQNAKVPSIVVVYNMMFIILVKCKLIILVKCKLSLLYFGGYDFYKMNVCVLPAQWSRWGRVRCTSRTSKICWKMPCFLSSRSSMNNHAGMYIISINFSQSFFLFWKLFNTKDHLFILQINQLLFFWTIIIFIILIRNVTSPKWLLICLYTILLTFY